MGKSSRGAAMVLIALTQSGCESARVTDVDRADASVPVLLHLSSRWDGPSGRVMMWLGVDVTRVGAVQGVLTFDPERLQFAGQPEAGELSVAHEREPGVLHVAGVVDRDTGSRPVVLVFDVLGTHFSERLRLRVDAVADAAGLRLPAPRVVPIVVDHRWYPSNLRNVLIRAAGPHLTPHEPPANCPIGQCTPIRYGDVLMDGEVTGDDALAVARAVVGLDPWADDAAFVAIGNVSPANLPGTGAAGDPVPPGVEADGERVLDVLDVLAIARYVGRVPGGVVGQVLPF